MVIAALLAILGAIQAQNAGMSGMATTAMMLGAPAVLAAVIAEISRRNGGTTATHHIHCSGLYRNTIRVGCGGSCDCCFHLLPLPNRC